MLCAIYRTFEVVVFDFLLELMFELNRVEIFFMMFFGTLMAMAELRWARWNLLLDIMLARTALEDADVCGLEKAGMSAGACS